MKIEGLDEFKEKLDDLAKKAEELDGTHSVSISEVLTPKFISTHTRFSNADELFEAGGFKCDTQDDFDVIPEDKLDQFIRSESSFNSWDEMLGQAAQEWAANKLGL